MGALSGARKAAKKAGHGVARLFRGTEHPDIEFNGKPPSMWTPEDFEAYGAQYGVPNLGPLSPIENVSGVDVPGGLGGEFTYYDLMHLKSSALDPNAMPEDVSRGIQRKFSRTLTPDPEDDTQLFNRYAFGMLSPNQPLTPNEFEAARIMARSDDDIAAWADRVPWEFGDKIGKPERMAAQRRDAKLLGTNAVDQGGIGVKGTADYTNISELAKTFEGGDAGWWRKSPDESWADLLTRVQSQGRGLSSKVGSFSTVWQDPGDASISAIDRHMARKFEPHLFEDQAEYDKYAAAAVKKYNEQLGKIQDAQSSHAAGKLSDKKYHKKLGKLVSPDGAPVSSIEEIPNRPGGPSLLDDIRMNMITATKSRTLRNPKGELNTVPEVEGVDWIREPNKAEIIGDKYNKALAINQADADARDLGLFESQWNQWDRIRGRLEPHEIMFPGLEKLPPMSKEQLALAMAEHKKAGYFGGVTSQRRTGRIC